MNVFDVADTFVRHVKEKHPADVGIIFYYGSHVTGIANKRSDIDLMFIADDVKDLNLYRSFVADNIGFEFWGAEWDFFEDIVEGRNFFSIAPSILLNSKILYSRSDKDMERFNSLKERTLSLFKSENKSQLIQNATDSFKDCTFYLYKLNLALKNKDQTEAKISANSFLDSIIVCLCLINQKCFPNPWPSDITQIDILRIKPDNLKETIKQVIKETNISKICDLAESLCDNVRSFILDEQRSVRNEKDILSILQGVYPYVKEYVNKMLSACENKNIEKFASAVTALQNDIALMTAKGKTGISFSNLNLYNEFSQIYKEEGIPDLVQYIGSNDFSKISEMVKKFDKKTKDLLKKYNIKTNVFQAMKEVEAYIKN